MIDKEDPEQAFFNFIQKGNIDEVINIIKDGTKRPWEYLEDENYTGIIDINQVCIEHVFSDMLN